MSDTSPPDDQLEQTALLAMIGHICLQWALLEQVLIGIIAAAENHPLEKTYARYGRLDMLDRVKMALSLMREHKWPQRFISPIEDIRRTLQKGGDALAEQRNLYVHGAHEPTDTPGEYSLTMVRWPSSKRRTVVTASDAAVVVLRIAELAQKAEGVFTRYGVWKFGPQYETDRDQQIAETKATIRRIRAHNIKRAIKLLWANLKP